MTPEREDFVHHTTLADIHRPMPERDDKTVHILRKGERTFCGIGAGEPAWRVSIRGASRNVNGDGWSICALCCQDVPAASRSRALLPDELRDANTRMLEMLRMALGGPTPHPIQRRARHQTFAGPFRNGRVAPSSSIPEVFEDFAVWLDSILVKHGTLQRAFKQVGSVVLLEEHAASAMGGERSLIWNLSCVPHDDGSAPAPTCGKRIEDCGGSCCLDVGHAGDCECVGDEPGQPGSCPA